MMINGDKDTISFLPENDLDSYDLGRMSHLVPHVVRLTSNTDEPETRMIDFVVKKGDFVTMLAKLLDKYDE